MSTPLDKLRRYGLRAGSARVEETTTRVFEDMHDAPVLDISNVAAYYYESTASGKEWVVQDFPNIAPTFRTCWVSSSTAPAGFDGFVLAAAARELEEDDFIFDPSDMLFDGAFGSDGFVPLMPKPENVRWQQDILAIAQQGRRFHPIALQSRYINQDGSAHLSNGRPRQITQVLGPENMGWQDKKDAIVVAGRLMEYPLLLATSLMHCRNVRLLKDEVPLRVARRHERKHGFPLATRYTLLIDPMRKVLQQEGGASSQGLPKALHICRGHFKTYSDDKPLFGKLSGTYWWEQSVRGSKKHGEVIKDYSVKAPGAEREPRTGQL